jgi:hypothetical protein
LSYSLSVVFSLKSYLFEISSEFLSVAKSEISSFFS